MIKSDINAGVEEKGEVKSGLFLARSHDEGKLILESTATTVSRAVLEQEGAGKIRRRKVFGKVLCCFSQNRGEGRLSISRFLAIPYPHDQTYTHQPSVVTV